MIPNEILDEFKKIYFDDKHVQISDAEALESCTALFSILDIITKPILTSDKEGRHYDTRH